MARFPRAVALLVMLVGVGAADDAGRTWRRLAPIPDSNGLAGAAAGVCGGRLLVAGGANFQTKKPWEVGAMVWNDDIYVLDRAGAAEWTKAGKLPRPLGYGVSITYRDAVVIAGGSDATKHYADVLRVSWKDHAVVVEDDEIPSLPRPIANACGARVGDRLYIVGGQTSPTSVDALDTLLELDLAAPKSAMRWRELERCPGGGRILAVAAAVGDDCYIVGGAALSPGAGGANAAPVRRYLTDAWRYRRGEGWTRVADVPRAVTAAPSPAPSDARGFTILGGDDGSQVGVTPPHGHKGFSTAMLRFDVASGKWQNAGELAAARVTTPCVRSQGGLIIRSGEIFPGVPSPEVWALSGGAALKKP
jgi:N-acetylneuraminic acid mutarotase